MPRNTTLSEIREERTLLLPTRPLTFDEFVRLFGEDDDVELVDGMVVKRMAAKDIHEDLFRWLLFVIWGLCRSERSWVSFVVHGRRLR